MLELLIKRALWYQMSYEAWKISSMDNSAMQTCLKHDNIGTKTDGSEHMFTYLMALFFGGGSGHFQLE